MRGHCGADSVRAMADDAADAVGDLMVGCWNGERGSRRAMSQRWSLGTCSSVVAFGREAAAGLHGLHGFGDLYGLRGLVGVASEATGCCTWCSIAHRRRRSRRGGDKSISTGAWSPRQGSPRFGHDHAASVSRSVQLRPASRQHWRRATPAAAVYKAQCGAHRPEMMTEGLYSTCHSCQHSQNSAARSGNRRR